MEALERILRIRAMEALFDDLLSAAERGELRPQADPSQKEKLSILFFYYDSPLWLSDYEADERGELPKGLKRGILSQDGFYNFITELPSGWE